MVEQVGRYRIERELGRGGMGVVYLAYDPTLGRKVAIKTIHFEITDAAQREYLRTQLLRDARASAGLSHPNVVNVHDIIESGDTTYLVMEYISGETLAARMQRSPAPDTAWLLRILRDIAAALDYTHRKGVVHRDVKPGNVMIDAQSRVRIMDFGLARATAQRTGSTRGMVAGTIQYMSPEQIRGDALDGRADQFSMAAVAYEMLTGKPLFEARTPVTLAQKILNDEPVPAHTQNPLLPAATSSALAKALDRQASNRYPTCTAFVEALIATFDGETVQALLRPPEEQPTIALTGMMDVDLGPIRATAPVEAPVKRNGHAPLLIGVGLVLSTVAVTAVTLINGHSHGEAPKRPEAIYGTLPMVGTGPTAPVVKAPKRDGRPPAPPAVPAPESAEKNTRDDAQRGGDHRGPRGDVRGDGDDNGDSRRHGPPRGFPFGDRADLRGDPGHTPPEFRDNPQRRNRGKKGDDPYADIPDFAKQFLPDFVKDLRGPESQMLKDGRKELSLRNYGIAVVLFNAAVKASPDDYNAYYYRGAAYLGMGSPKQAQADYQKVVELKPDYAQGWYQLGIAMERQHHLKEALDEYARAETLKPDFSDAYLAAAMIYDQQEASKKALAEMDKAIAASPNYIRGYQARGDLKKKLGDPTAQDDLQKARDLAAQRKGPPGKP